MKGPRSPQDARLAAYSARAGAGPSLDEDVRRVVPVWADVLDLVEGARQRGWTDAQIDYLKAVVGVTWTKAYRRGEEAARREQSAK